ncbi:predicted protein [Plenodomus lingam JN3]|uniref:Predicted protein n=1 Tax=Leptosphaeria maculans (strain JN3 / isolate v23.1.3 / race Av1-4-5-6-7-8) TaxID=985895 RepID=E4ZMG2_LEPMJ|nr:predicted protein [Plenodomus lingam JN3]CBX92831.1 predicted protein [Plenodomus lingam JN3]
MRSKQQATYWLARDLGQHDLKTLFALPSSMPGDSPMPLGALLGPRLSPSNSVPVSLVCYIAIYPKYVHSPAATQSPVVFVVGLLREALLHTDLHWELANAKVRTASSAATGGGGGGGAWWVG